MIRFDAREATEWDLSHDPLLEAAVDRLKTSGLAPAALDTKHLVARRHLDRETAWVTEVKIVGCADAPTSLYLKEFKPRTRATGFTAWMSHLRESLGRAEEMAERFARVATPEGILSPRVLAVDTERLKIVTLGVPGRPLSRKGVFLGRLDAAPGTSRFRKIGRALRLIADSCGPVCDFDATRDFARPSGPHIARMQSRLGRSQLPRLIPCLEDLYRQASAKPSDITYAHGDVSTSNILVNGNHIGLIDFGWIPRFREDDLVKFVLRLEFSSRWRLARPASAIEAVLEGFDDPAVTSRPGWRFGRLRRLLQMASIPGRENRKSAWTGQTAFTELETALTGMPNESSS